MNAEVKRGVASVEIAGAILQALKMSNKAVALQDLARLTGLSSSRLHHYLVSLVRIGLVRRDEKSNRYALGTFAMELGLVAADNLPTQHASASRLHRLSDETGESSFFAVPSPRGMLTVRWEQGSRPLTVHARLGTMMPILTSATGLVWLAFDTEKSRPVLEGEIRRIEPGLRNHTRTARLAEAAEVRRTRIAMALGTMSSNVKALAYPVVGRSGKFVGAMTVLGLSSSFDARVNGTTAKLLRRHAEDFGRSVE